MSIVKILDDVTEWARKNICTKIELKVPPKDTEPSDGDYDYKTANPVAFTMYVPTEDKLPKTIPAAFPSLCVRFMVGSDDLSSKSGTIGIQFLLSAWNPGTHPSDLCAEANNGPPKWKGAPDTEAVFERNGEGWRDIWNFVGIALNAVESTSTISGYEIDPAVPVKFGPLTEQESIPDFYPFWFAWVTFQLKYPLLRNTDYQQFL